MSEQSYPSIWATAVHLLSPARQFFAAHVESHRQQLGLLAWTFSSWCRCAIKKSFDPGLEQTRVDDD